MNEGLQRASWATTSELMAMMANIWAGKRSKRFLGSDFNPFPNEPNSDQHSAVPVDVLRHVFIERKPI